jgi:hypothetical protein
LRCPRTGRAPIKMSSARLRPSALAVASSFIMLVLSFLNDMIQSIWKRLCASREECPLCCNMRVLVPGNCGHSCCEECWRGWFRANERAFLNSCRRRRGCELTCWGCQEPLARSLLQDHATDKLIHLCMQLEKREEYVRRAGNWQIAECTRCGIGVGYDDGFQTTAMCFLCEQYARLVPALSLSLQRKICPRAETCLRGHSFRVLTVNGRSNAGQWYSVSLRSGLCRSGHSSAPSIASSAPCPAGGLAHIVAQPSRRVVAAP